MELHTLAFCLRNHMNGDFTPSNLRDIKEYAIAELKRRGVAADPMATLDQITALVEVLCGERQAVAA